LFVFSLLYYVHLRDLSLLRCDTKYSSSNIFILFYQHFSRCDNKSSSSNIFIIPSYQLFVYILDFLIVVVVLVGIALVHALPSYSIQMTLHLYYSFLHKEILANP
jgi:hypothetical protein